MKKNTLSTLTICAFAVGTVACGQSNGDRARATQPSSARSPVAVVDVSRIFQEHKGFKSSMDTMKNEVQEFEQHLRSDHEAMSKDRMKLQSFKPGSQDYKQLEQEIADLAAKLQVKTQQKKREFLEREARVYYFTYMHVSKAIELYADGKGYSLVLRHTGEQINPDDRASVLAGVNRAVVYYRGGIDITSGVLSILDRVPQPQQSSNNLQATRPSRTGSPSRSNTDGASSNARRRVPSGQ